MPDKRILIVEDEPIIALELSERLQQYGYKIAGIASNGIDAQKKFKGNSVDLILLDISLKGDLNGIQFAEILRQSSDVPIIYITAFSDESTLAKAKLTQPSGFLLKPFNQRELETTIEISLYKHEVEKKLKENERWLNSTLHGISDAIITTDKRGSINFANSAAEQIIGMAKEEMIGSKVETIIKYEDQVTQFTFLDSTIVDLGTNRGTDSFLETILINNNNQRLNVEQKATLLRDDFGNISGTVFVIRDLTAKKIIQAELNKSESRYKAVIEQITDGIIIYDFETHKVLETNSAYRKLTGYSEEELLTKITEDLVYQGDVPTSHFETILKKNKTFNEAPRRKHRGIKL